MAMKKLAFDWDQWNVQKNEIKHGISALEAESAFYDRAMVVFQDFRHSGPSEQRWIAYGTSAYHHVLMIAFTVRNENVRIISARKASRKERRVYEENKA